MNKIGLEQFASEALYFGDLVIADAEEPYNDTVDSAAIECDWRQQRNVSGDIEICHAPIVCLEPSR